MFLNQYFPSWIDVKNEIDNNRPFTLAMLFGGTAIGRNSSYGNHVVACVGYKEDTETNQKFLILHDTWEPLQETYLAFNNWWGAMATWVRPQS